MNEPDDLEDLAAALRAAMAVLALFLLLGGAVALSAWPWPGKALP